MFNRIVVPLDGSELAEQALQPAVELAIVSGVPICLVRIVDAGRLEGFGPYGLAVDYGGSDAATRAERRAAVEYLGRLRRIIEERGLSVSSELLEGNPARLLVEAQGPGDLIVMATHGRGGLTRWLLGSVAEEVVRHAVAPVLLIRATQTRAVPDVTAAIDAPA